MTVLVALFGLWLVVSQIQYVLQERYTYKFVPDTEYESKLQIHIDITVASICDSKLPTYTVQNYYVVYLVVI